MFAYCTKCNYDSGDKPNQTELEQKVKEDGGRLDPELSVCPKCKATNTLRVD